MLYSSSPNNVTFTSATQIELTDVLREACRSERLGTLLHRMLAIVTP